MRSPQRWQWTPSDAGAIVRATAEYSRSASIHWRSVHISQTSGTTSTAMPIQGTLRLITPRTSSHAAHAASAITTHVRIPTPRDRPDQAPP